MSQRKSPSSREGLLGLHHCRKAYQRYGTSDIVALSDVSLMVDEGEFVAIVGSNGAGKSTLLNVVAGSSFVDEGSVWFDGRNITEEPSWRRARFMWTIRQIPEQNVMGPLTIEENIALAMAYRKKGTHLGRAVTRPRRAMMTEILSTFNLGLESRLGSLASELSGGQRQAVAVAMAILARPELLLLDEHTASLDPRSSELVLTATRKLAQDSTTLMVSHNLEQAVAASDRILVMHRGSIIADVTRNSLVPYTADALLRVFEQATEGEVPDVVHLATTEG